MRAYPKGSPAWHGQTISKADADYRKGTDTEQCSQCSMFRSPSSCTLVEGEIKPDGVCDYFDRKK